MEKHRKILGSVAKKTVCVAVIIFLSLMLIQIAPVALAQSQNSSSNWGLKIQVSKVGANVTGTGFAPFDQIQLSANVTYNNASQPNILVSFQVQSPTGSIDPINITRIEATNSSGEAAFPFRLPIESDNQSALVGTWQASATIQTTNGTLQQKLSFIVQWNMEITSINLQNSQGQDQTTFSPGDTVEVQLTINNTAQPQAANITLNMQDIAGNIVNQTQILNSQIDTSSTNLTQLQTDLQIPSNTAGGQMEINAALYSGNYLDFAIPAGENQTASFTIAGNTTTTPTPTPTSTATPTSGPTPTPNVIENSVSLFSWLLVATGLFTFTSLFMFLKRRPMPKINTQMPHVPPTIPGPTISTPSTQSLLQQPTTTTETPNAAPQKPSEPSIKSILPQQALESQVLTNLSRISETANRIQALKAELKLEREQLTKDLSELNKTVEDQQKAVKSYFDDVRTEIEKLETLLTDKDITPPPPQPPKPTQQKTEDPKKE